MTDDTDAPRSRPWMGYIGGAMLLAFGYIAFSAWSAAPLAKVGFDLTANLDEEPVTIGGAVSVADGAFEFDGSRISFSGKVEGNQVSIDGRIVNGDRTVTRSFKGGGTISGGRSSVTVKSPEGRRLGTLKLDFNPA